MTACESKVHLEPLERNREKKKVVVNELHNDSAVRPLLRLIIWSLARWLLIPSENEMLPEKYKRINHYEYVVVVGKSNLKVFFNEWEVGFCVN